jgi:hypothetical protein
VSTAHLLINVEGRPRRLVPILARNENRFLDGPVAVEVVGDRTITDSR